jgi:hypothetical protein
MAKYKAKKECFTTYINHQGKIFKAVNRIHKIKKRGPSSLRNPFKMQIKRETLKHP